MEIEKSALLGCERLEEIIVPVGEKQRFIELLKESGIDYSSLIVER